MCFALRVCQCASLVCLHVENSSGNISFMYVSVMYCADWKFEHAFWDKAPAHAGDGGIWQFTLPTNEPVAAKVPSWWLNSSWVVGREARIIDLGMGTDLFAGHQRGTPWQWHRRKRHRAPALAFNREKMGKAMRTYRTQYWSPLRSRAQAFKRLAKLGKFAERLAQAQVPLLRRGLADQQFLHDVLDLEERLLSPKRPGYRLWHALAEHSFFAPFRVRPRQAAAVDRRFGYSTRRALRSLVAQAVEANVGLFGPLGSPD